MCSCTFNSRKIPLPRHLFPPKLRIRLLMIWSQSQRDQYVLTAKWFPFSFETFSLIIVQKIYSLYAVLRDFIQELNIRETQFIQQVSLIK